MFELTHPWLLLLLPLPWLLRFLLPPAKTGNDAALKVPFYQTLVQLYQDSTMRDTNRLFSKILAYLLWLALVIAVTNPLWLGEPVELPRSGRDIMLAVDISGSMQLEDMQLNDHIVDRLTVVKEVAGQFIQQREGDRLGLILFGSKAYLQTPLTFDRKTVAQQLEDATIGLAGQETAMGDALGIALKNLQKNPGDNRVIVLLTDGVNNGGVLAPLQAAKLAQTLKIRIYTIGIGAEELLVPGMFGQRSVNPSAQLDVKTLTEMADLTGGEFFRAKDTQALQKAYQELDELEPINRESAVYRPKISLYPWPLGFALIISFVIALRHLSWPTRRKNS